MDHAINDLKQHLRATIGVYKDVLTYEELVGEVQPYVNAINILVVAHYLPGHQHGHLTTVDEWI